MIQRHQRCALAARFHIGAAEIIDHVNAGQPRQQTAVANLPGPVLSRPVQDGLAVKADQGDLVCRQSRFLQQRLHRIGMRLRQQPFGITDGMGHGGAFGHVPRRFQRGGQQGAGFLVIGNGQAGAGAGNVFAVRLQQGSIHPVQGGAAHQADHFQDF